LLANKINIVRKDDEKLFLKLSADVKLTMNLCVRCKGVELDWNGLCRGVGMGPSYNGF
jgi:hypothetical protein